jgi:hypothetical protein
MDERKSNQSHILPGPIINGQEEKKNRRKKEYKILVLVWVLHYLTTFFFVTSTRFKTPAKPFCKNFLSLLGEIRLIDLPHH